MFDVKKDERLMQVTYRAGFWAFCVMATLSLCGMVIDHFLQDLFTVPHSLLMFVPWFAGLNVFAALSFRGGITAAVREEQTRTPSGLKAARMGAALMGILSGLIAFGMRRLLPGRSGLNSLGSDVAFCVVFGVALGLAQWFVSARKVKSE